MKEKKSEKKALTSKENLKKALEARKLKGIIEKKCQGCGKDCTVYMAQIRKGWKYCSWKCRTETMRGDKASNAGGGKWMLGENNINYKHGKSLETLKRDLKLVNQWRRRVFERDKYICQRCNYKDGKILRAHHIVPWAKNIDLRFELSNGLTLCNPCHKWVHSKANTNKDYLLCK